MQMPNEDRYLLTIEELEDQIAVMMGGRAAETASCFGTISTGASDDIQRATELARRMVTEFGMSEKLGSVRYAGQRAPVPRRHASTASQRQPADAARSSTPRCSGSSASSTSAPARSSPCRRAALEALAQRLLAEETVDGSAVRRALDEHPPEATIDRVPAATL